MIRSSANVSNILPVTPGVPVVIPQYGGAPRVLGPVTAGPRALTIAGTTMNFDPTQVTARDIMHLINMQRIAGVVANLDGQGQLVIPGVTSSQVTGDATLLQLLGFA